MRRRTNWVILIAAVVALAGLAPADTVKLKSGLAMESVTIEGFDGNTITVGLGRLPMAVKLQDVESIQLTGKAAFNKAELLRADQPAKARQEYLKEGAGAAAWLQKLIAARLTGLPEETPAPPVATRPAVAPGPTVAPTPMATAVTPAVASNTVSQPAIASRPTPAVPPKPANPYASPETLIEWMKTTLTPPDTSKMTTIQREPAIQEYESVKAKWVATHDPRGKEVSWRIEVLDVVKADKKIVLSGKSKGGTTVRANFPATKTSSLVNISKGQNVTLTGLVEAVQPTSGDGGEDEACIVLQGKLVKAE